MTDQFEILTALYALDRVKGFGPNKFKLLYEKGIPFSHILHNPTDLPVQGKMGAMLKDRVESLPANTLDECKRQAEHQLGEAMKQGGRVITYVDHEYPQSVFESNNPIPVLYVRGAVSVLEGKQAVAVVGSREIRPPYSIRQEEFACVASKNGFVVVSGFALGADSIAHRTAYREGGKTICVMPNGLDRPFPPENRELWNLLLSYSGAVFVTEFPFGARASALRLRKRNKLIVAFARGVLVGQSAKNGGAMNAYRFAKEQKKRIATFEADGNEDTSGNVVITEDDKFGGIAFPLTVVADSAYCEWLQKLSSST